MRYGVDSTLTPKPEMPARRDLAANRLTYAVRPGTGPGPGPGRPGVARAAFPARRSVKRA
jgi:hypothetical protein